MIKKTLHEIAEMIDVLNDVSAYDEVVIHGVCIDTRKLVAGNLFVPFIGEQIDGHHFVEEAIQNGAAAALWQKNVPNAPVDVPLIIVEDTLLALQQLARNYRQQLDVKVIGITGSNGKTTTKDIVSNLLSTTYKVQKTEGNYNNHLGLPLTILQLKEDTEFAVLEMGMSNRGEIRLLTKLARPETVIITNVGESHLLHLGSREGIAAAKLEIVEGLADDGLIVYFGDEPLLHTFFSEYTGHADVKTFGKNETNNFYVTEARATNDGSYFKINHTADEFYLPVLGAHNLLNTMAAMVVAQYYRIPFEQMNEGLAHVKLTQMRMEIIAGANGERIINDAYNASPTSMKAAIELVAHLPGDEMKVVVLGDIFELGPNEEAYHFEIGTALHPDEIDFVFTYGQLAKKIGEGALQSFPAHRVYSFTEIEPLVQKVKSVMNGKGIVLVKASRGMKLEKVVRALQK